MMRWLHFVSVVVACVSTIACVSSSRSSSAGGNGSDRTRAADGASIAFRVAGNAHGDPTIVFVHGFGCDSTFFDAAIAHVSQRRRVLAIDLPGHGEADAKRVNWTMEAFGDDVRRACDAIGAEHVILVGHSMGGPVILEAAREMSGRVLALIPVDTFHDVDRKPTQAQIEQLVETWRADFAGSASGTVRGSFHQPIRDPKYVDMVITKLTAMQRDVGLALLDSMFHYDVSEGLDSTTLPIRCINSAEVPTNLAAGRKYAKRFDVRTIPEVGHYLMLEDPEAFNALLDAAIDELAR
ncbi:MAG: alpha/beta hydrolase [Planctomycetota bacterium]|nr:alpha/beta hydrolase [Planctomycetota bacterium]